MRLGVRAKLFTISVLLVLGGVGAAGLFLEGELRRRLEWQIEQELSRHAHSMRALVDAAAADDRPETLDRLADRIGAATDMRVTVIDDAGRVLGDSELDLAQIAAVENHRNRPEVRGALARGYGSSRRYSTTIDTDLLYVAVPLAGARAGWVARVARPLSEVDAAIGRLRRQILVAGLIALLAAGGMSLLTSSWMVRALRQLAENARAIARGETRGRLTVAGSDELGRLAGSLNRLAENIEDTVAELASERARFEAVLEGMSEGVIALDAERRVTLMNSAALKLLELDEAPVERSLVDLVRAPALHELIADPTAEAGAAEFDLGDAPRRVLAQVAPERAGGGCIVVLHDISALRRLEVIRRDFVANVSHELRTPVSVIQANAETLLQGALDDPDNARPMLQALYRNTQRMSRIIADLLDLSRLESGRYEIAEERVAIRGAAARAAEAVERAAAEKRTAIEVDVPDHLAARADAKALDQVLVNLLDNAIKYTPEGGHVRLSARAGDDAVRIEVRDDGPGIPEHHQQRVFERFYRVDPGRSRDMGGTGLGLSIVKHLVDVMGGRVGVGSADPHGAVFWVELPAA